MKDEKVNILLVDDQPGKLLAHEAILDDLDAKIVTADSGRKALECLLHSEFAVILLDVNMPEMDGFEIAGIIRKHPRFENTPIIFVTAYAASELDRLRGYDLGAVDFIFLPVIPEILRAKVKVFVQLARQQQLLRDRDELEQRVEERTAELRKSNEELTRSNKELEAFAYIASHDLQEPLRMVTSYVQLIQRALQDPMLREHMDTYVRHAVEGVERMRKLLDDLLDYSRVRSRPLALVEQSLEKPLLKVLANLEPSIRESGAVITHEALPVLSVDASQMIQLFQNLLSNAIKFRRDEPPRIHVGVQQEEAGWKFHVQDNGIGIEPQYFERVFHIFQRLHTRGEYQGGGVGLAICKLVVERHGGKIWVESTPGKTSTFYFLLPHALSRKNGSSAKSKPLLMKAV